MPHKQPASYTSTHKNVIEQFGGKKGIEKIGFRVNFVPKNSSVKIASLCKYSDPYIRGSFHKPVQQTFPM